MTRRRRRTMVLARRRRGSRTVIVNRRRNNYRRRGNNDRSGRGRNNNRRRSRRRSNNYRRGCRSNNYRSRGDDPANEIHDTIGKCQTLIVVVMGKSAGADAGDRDCKQNFQLSIHNFFPLMFWVYIQGSQTFRPYNVFVFEIILMF